MSHPGMLAKIHIARKDLALEEEAYRGLLRRVAGVASSRDLSDRQADAVLTELKRLGWKPKAATRAPAQRPDLRMVYALWGALHSGPLDREALRKWVQQRFSVSAPEFLKPAQTREAIEQLKAWQKRLKDPAR